MLPMCSENLRRRLVPMLKQAGLPTDCSADAQAVIADAMHDKKTEAGAVVTVQVGEPGSFRFEKCTREELLRLYKEVFA